MLPAARVAVDRSLRVWRARVSTEREGFEVSIAGLILV